MIDYLASGLMSLALLGSILIGGILAIAALTFAMAVVVAAMAVKAGCEACRHAKYALESKLFFVRHDAIYIYRMRRYGSPGIAAMSRTRAAWLTLIDILTF